MCDFSSFKTGDLCVTKTLGKFASLIRTITISNYNHVTVAIRIDPAFLPQLKIVRTGGILLFLEKSKNPENGEIQRVIRINAMMNIKTLRFPLKDEHYTEDFEKRVENLLYLTAFKVEPRIKEYIKIQKPEGFTSDLKLVDRSVPIPQIQNVCSENTADFYSNTLQDKIDKNVVPAVVFVPHTFIGSKGNPYYGLFDPAEVIYDVNPTNDYWWELIIVILFIIVILILLYYGARFLYRKYYL